MKVISLFSNLHSENFHWVNSINIVFIPKKEVAESVTDYRPISLIHVVAKIVAKMMATHLAPFMNSLVSRAQSVFIKMRSIHDNYGQDWLLAPLFCSMGQALGGLCRTVQCKKPIWAFRLVAIMNLAAFFEPLWPSYLDACTLICSVFMVCLPHTQL
jgi:hypothetical protein